MYFVSLSEYRNHYGFVCDSFESAKEKMCEFFRQSIQFDNMFSLYETDEFFKKLNSCLTVEEVQVLIWTPGFDYISTNFREVLCNEMFKIYS